MRTQRFNQQYWSWRFGPGSRYPEGDYYEHEQCVEPSCFTPEELSKMIGTSAYEDLVEVLMDPALEVDEGL